jgi:hypothetical protein
VSRYGDREPERPAGRPPMAPLAKGEENAECGIRNADLGSCQWSVVSGQLSVERRGCWRCALGGWIRTAPQEPDPQLPLRRGRIVQVLLCGMVCFDEMSKRYARLGIGPRDWTIPGDFSIARGGRARRAIAERSARLEEGRSFEVVPSRQQTNAGEWVVQSGSGQLTVDSGQLAVGSCRGANACCGGKAVDYAA